MVIGVLMAFLKHQLFRQFLILTIIGKDRAMSMT